MSGAAVELDALSKRYRGGGGVTDLTLAVRSGEVFGFLGPNGAGKTTTIRILLDLIRADSGTATILGLDSRRDGVEVRRRIGYLPGELALYDRMTAREVLGHIARLRGGVDPAIVTTLVERLDLELDRPTRTLSRGNKQKVGLVQALMNEPELVILDEPTNGLDPLMQHEVHHIIDEIRAEGRTVFLSSHALGEVSRVADRVGIIRSGRLVTVEDVTALRARAVHHIEVRTAGEAPAAELSSLAGVRSFESDDEDVVRFEFAGAIDPVVKLLSQSEILELTIHEPDLEEVFLDLYTEDEDEREHS